MPGSGEHGLRAATWSVNFDTIEELRAAVEHLIKCHPHHFIVAPDHNLKIVVSAFALECLNRRAFDA